MTKGILGKKIGMTQVYSKEGAFVPVTVIEAGPCHILQVKTKDKDRYSAVQLGFCDAKESYLNKPLQGHFKKANVTAKRFIKEIRTEGEFKAGDKIELDFEEGTFVDVTGTSIGKGFQGGVKRHGWHGGAGSHGSMFHRTVGSVSASSYPSRIFKGHRMPGRMGREKKTIQNLEVVKVDKENNLLIVKGAVPGHKNSYLVIMESKKRKGKKKPPPVKVVKKEGKVAKTAAKAKAAATSKEAKK